jgi:hypothetical protein
MLDPREWKREHRAHGRDCFGLAPTTTAIWAVVAEIRH